MDVSTDAVEPTEFERGGHTYRIERMSALQQFHVSRRVAPLIPPLIPMFMEIARLLQAEGKSVKDGLGFQTIMKLAEPFAEGLASLDDATAEYVINACMSVVKRKSANTWVAVWNKAASRPMFRDLDNVAELIPMVVEVIKDALGPFIEGLLTAQQASPTPVPAEICAASPEAKTG
jgi:hypothetical protein